MKTLNQLFTLSIAFCLAMGAPPSTEAAITNTASVTYKDSANVNYSGTSNTVTVQTPPVISSALSAVADVGVPFSYNISATNSPTSYGATGLPAGLSINTGNGLISGTPTAAGTVNVTISATNAAGTGTAVLVLQVRGNPNVVLTKTASAPTAAVGSTITFTINYQNTGSGSATNVTLTDTIPSGSTLVSGSVSNGGTVTGGTIQWVIGTLAPGANGSVSFRVTVN